MNRVIAAQSPEAQLTDFAVLESHVWGEGKASSAGRIVIRPVYEQQSPSLPRNLVLKVARTVPEEPGTPLRIAGAGGALYENEVAAYARLRPSTFLEAPLVLGGAYESQTNALLLIVEDLRDRDATFASVTLPTSVERMQSILDQLAIFHARYWDSPELEGSLSWMEVTARHVLLVAVALRMERQPRVRQRDLLAAGSGSTGGLPFCGGGGGIR